MSIVNRRNAVLGWAAWQVAKGVAKRKAKSAVPVGDSDTKRLKKPALVAALAGVGALVMFRRKKGGDELPPIE